MTKENINKPPITVEQFVNNNFHNDDEDFSNYKNINFPLIDVLKVLSKRTKIKEILFAVLFRFEVKPYMKYIRISNKDLRKDMIEIIKLLPKFKNLEGLILNGSNIGEDIIPLAKAIAKLPNLQTLELLDIDFKGKHVELAKELSKSTSLNHIEHGDSRGRYNYLNYLDPRYNPLDHLNYLHLDARYKIKLLRSKI